jgi:hypothetical protein
MKKKKIVISISALTLLLLICFGYIQLSTQYINKYEYKKIAYNHLSVEEKKTLTKSMNKFYVEKVKITSRNMIVGVSDFNYTILKLNGGYCIRVSYATIHPVLDVFWHAVYINPFTKKIIGFAATM